MRRRQEAREEAHVPPPPRLVDPVIEDFVSTEERQSHIAPERLALERWQAEYEAWGLAGVGLPPADIDVMLWDRQACVGNVRPRWRNPETA